MSNQTQAHVADDLLAEQVFAWRKEVTRLNGLIAQAENPELEGRLLRRGAQQSSLVHGVGIYDPTVMCMRDAPHLLRLYSIWKGMLFRTNPKYAVRNPTYVGVTVGTSFIRFSDFADWAVKQVGWDRADFHLDKDLAFKGNRVYSQETCCFLPMKINLMLLSRNTSKGLYPMGVGRTRNGKRYYTRIYLEGKYTVLGYFDTPEEAFGTYKAAKEGNVQRMANLHRHELDPRAYEALMAYRLEIDD